MTNLKPRYYLVDASFLPEVFIKVADAKALIETGEAHTVAQATAMVGISRSAFYKYKDAITPFQDMKHGRIITFHVTLRDKMGVLSRLLSVFAGTGANILTINQSIPLNGIAVVTVSAEVSDMTTSTEDLMRELQSLQGVKKVEAIAG